MRKYLTTSHWEKEKEAACIKRNGRLEAVCVCRGKNKRRNNKDMEGSWSFLHQCIVHLRHLTFTHIKKIGRVAAGLAGSWDPGQRVSLRPRPVPCPGRPGPGSTRRAGPGFKTMVIFYLNFQFNKKFSETAKYHR